MEEYGIKNIYTLNKGVIYIVSKQFKSNKF